jgi:hypothetical protein
MQYEDYIGRAIIANNEFGIIQVRSFHHIKSDNLDWNEYRDVIVKLAMAKNIVALKQVPTNPVVTTEYLTIMKFIDQNKNIWRSPELHIFVVLFESVEMREQPATIARSSKDCVYCV